MCNDGQMWLLYTYFTFHKDYITMTGTTYVQEPYNLNQVFYKVLFSRAYIIVNVS